MNVMTLDRAKAEAAATPLADIDVSRPELYVANAHWPLFDRLRAEDPVHYLADSDFGPFWSITRWDDIMKVETNPKVFSSSDGIFMGDRPDDFQPRSFIGEDDPLHSKWRKPVMPGVGGKRLDELEALIRQRVIAILDDLPRDEEPDFQREGGNLRQDRVADHVSVEDVARPQTLGLGQRRVILALHRDHQPPHPQRPEAECHDDD